MMISSVKNDVGCGLKDTDINGLRDMINKDSSVSNMRSVFRRSGQPCLFDDGVKKVEQGLTTIEEVLRVTEVYGRDEDEIFVENAA
jgi:hypothetical protein